MSCDGCWLDFHILPYLIMHLICTFFFNYNETRVGNCNNDEDGKLKMAKSNRGVRQAKEKRQTMEFLLRL